ncbi:MAG: hypothetical protein HQK49_17180 [Oligoflexia bacterium]|nr:hypothetical protein [Oligoflexia bacterium]
MAGPQRKKKIAKPTQRSHRVYSYATKDIWDWIEIKSYQHEVTFASFVFSALKYVNKTNPDFNPKDHLTFN